MAVNIREAIQDLKKELGPFLALSPKLSVM